MQPLSAPGQNQPIDIPKQSMPYGGIMEADACKVLSRKVMTSYDQGNKGFIDASEVTFMLQDCYRAINRPINPSTREIQGFIATLGKQGQTRINQSDVYNFVNKMFSGTPYNFQTNTKHDKQPSYIEERLDVARRLFKKLDADGSGYITEDEVYEIIRETYRQMGMKYEPTADDVRSWIMMTDSDGDGKVTLQDYENLVLKSLQQQAISYQLY